MTEDERLDLALVDSVEAAAIGEPGQRTFKITASSARGEAVIWMEKEQLFQIGLAIKQMAAYVDPPETPVMFEPEFPAPATSAAAEFKASEMKLRHDREADVFTVEAADSDSEEEDDEEEPAIAVQFSFPRKTGEALADQVFEIVAAGSPRCALCGGPVDPDGHVCPKTNGYVSGDFELSH